MSGENEEICIKQLALEMIEVFYNSTTQLKYLYLSLYYVGSTQAQVCLSALSLGQILVRFFTGFLIFALIYRRLNQFI